MIKARSSFCPEEQARVYGPYDRSLGVIGRLMLSVFRKSNAVQKSHRTTVEGSDKTLGSASDP
jgi:hypothetical protein